MDTDAAKELGRFRRMLATADLTQLVPIIASSLDEMIVVLRRIDPGNYGVEVAAALAAELHKRNSAPALPVARVGTA